MDLFGRVLRPSAAARKQPWTDEASTKDPVALRRRAKRVAWFLATSPALYKEVPTLALAAWLLSCPAPASQQNAAQRTAEKAEKTLRSSYRLKTLFETPPTNV